MKNEKFVNFWANSYFKIIVHFELVIYSVINVYATIFDKMPSILKKNLYEIKWKSNRNQKYNQLFFLFVSKCSFNSYSNGSCYVRILITAYKTELSKWLNRKIIKNLKNEWNEKIKQ